MWGATLVDISLDSCWTVVYVFRKIVLFVISDPLGKGGFVRRLLLLTSLSLVLALVLAPAALADHHPAHVVIPGHHQAQHPEGVPCPLGLDEMPPGTVCGEGGSYWVPDNAAQGQYKPTVTPTQTPTSTATSSPTATAVSLPETGGASGFALLAGALLVGGGVMSFALFRRT